MPDNTENRNIFYRDLLINYYNTMTDYVKSKPFGIPVVFCIFKIDEILTRRRYIASVAYPAAWV